ncbi:hypothetical protein [Microbacterium sp. SS28]|uniref:hypothetical protein n=1 Tax=Microbacterium sp. SS28 TaxID=2919948 RepID=UPI001FAAA365|nr:hypothetical protein [Microbacterium sp. SS28]
MPAHDPLLDAYRIIRRLDSTAETPWPGVLAHSEASGTVLLVEAESLGDAWPGWIAPADGHLLVPLDLVRHRDGHYAAMAPCSERLADFLRRREDAPLSDGERLTLAVSMLRGSCASTGLPEGLDSRGEWWLSEGGMPVFAFVDAGRPLGELTSELVHVVADAASGALAATLAEITESISDGTRLARNLPRLEAQLFETAAPEPLATTVLTPRRARAARIDGPTAGSRETFADEPEETRTILGRLARHVDADLADAFSQATTAVWRRFTRVRTPQRRRPIVVASLAAGVIVAGGMLWPAGGPATAEPAASATVEWSATPAQTPAPVEPPAEADPATTDAAPAGLEGVLDALLVARAACAQDDACLAGIIEEPGKPIAAGPVDTAPMRRRITLIDDFGGAAVLRVTSVDEAGGAQLVVIVLRDDEWLIRDVMDVADQPS